MDMLDAICISIAVATTAAAAIFFRGPGFVRFCAALGQVITDRIVSAAINAAAEWREIFCNTCEDELLEE